MDKLEQLIYEAIEVVIDVDRTTLSPNTRFDSLGLTSLDFITILFEIEDTLDISIPNSDRSKFTTIQEGIHYLRSRQAASTTA